MGREKARVPGCSAGASAGLAAQALLPSAQWAPALAELTAAQSTDQRKTKGPVRGCACSQKADWPQHKAICAQTIEGRAREVAESGDPSFPSRFFKWQKLCCAELAELAHGLLADHELKTHFVFIQADYVPDKKPYFRVGTHTCSARSTAHSTQSC